MKRILACRWFARPAGSFGVAVALAWPGALEAAEGGGRSSWTNPFDVALALLIGAGVGSLAWFFIGRERRASAHLASHRIEKMAALIEHADCVLWESEVDVTGREWRWSMKVHPSVFARKLFRGELPTGNVDMWAQFRMDRREEMDQRAREALEQQEPRYVQEFSAVRDGQVFWLREDVSITPLGGGRFWLVGLITDITARREAEAAQRQSELTVDRILAHAQCMLWRATVILEDGVLKWPHFDIPASQFSELLFGERVFNAERGFWESMTLPEQKEMDERSTRAILGGDAGYTQQFRAINRDGRMFWLNERVSITRVSETIWSLVGVVTDITAAHEAEEARQRSESRLAYLLERADTMLWQARVEEAPGQNLNWTMFIPPSQLYRRIFGGEPVNPRGFAWRDRGVPEHGDMQQQSFAAILSGAPGYEQQFHVPGPEGDIWLHEKVTIVSIGPGTWDLVGIITDITARHAAEEAWRSTQARLGKLLELADCMVWEANAEIGPDGKTKWDLYTQRSVLFRRIFGDRQETNLAWHTLVVPELPEMIERTADAMRRRASGYSQEFHVENPGETIWLREVVTMTELRPGNFRMVGVITDITAQRRAEEAQRKSELRLSALLDRADCMIWQGTVRRAAPDEFIWSIFTPNSQLYRRIFGKEASEQALFPFPWRELVPEFPAMQEASRAAMAKGLPGYEQVFHCEMPEGHVWLHEKVSVKPLGPDEWELIGIITDITAQHRAEMARKTSEARLQELLARADCLLWEATVVVDPNGGDWQWDLTVQPSYLGQKLYGTPDFSPKIGLWRTFEIPERQEMNERCLRAMREGQGGYEQVFHIVRPDGSVIWISESVTVHPAGPGKYSLVGVAVDITPQRTTEEALAAEKERLSVTLRAMNEAVITTDVTGVVQFMNPAAASLTGWSEQEAFGHGVAEICRLESSRNDEPLEVPVNRVARGDVVSDLPAQTRLVARRGQRRLIEGCCAPIHAVDSKVIGTVLVFRDVTEHERLEQELVRATRLESVGVLAGGIAHDFNNILTAVMGNLTLAQLDVPQNTHAAQSLRSAEKAALRARDLTQQLLTFAKGGEPVRAAVQLEAIVREMTSFALHGSQVKAFFDLAPDLWPADADKGQIGRVVQNLVINAVQAMSGGGTLRITARNDMLDGLTVPGLAPGSYIQIAITDTGEGIKSEHLARIFDPYFTTKQTGTGLGLAAVYSIVKKHHGHIDVESQLGQGTTFRIWLPALRGQHATAESRAPVTPGRINGRVLFMDDEEIIRNMAVLLLQRFGMTVDCAEDGAEAVEMYRAALRTNQRYDLVITDLTVPGGMGGLAALRKLKEIDPGVQAIVSSGYSSDPVLANYREHGFVAMVAKPYEVAELARVLREVLPERPVG